ncbi:MAG TPA: GntR family transcriptional regulator [Vicinamibacteria bacterium]|nr:GntR family transcriptional regulator [Vicinamibacteria bacterium]
MGAAASPLVLKSLREQVYEHLRRLLNRGELRPGAFLDLDALGERLGVSRTPLRDALLLLDAEGFVTILPRRGVQVRALTRDDIRHLYEIIGALESAALLAAFPRLGPRETAALRRLNAEMRGAIEADEFDRYYGRNLAFHDIFLDRCDNERLVRMVRTLKQRLYDWPRRRGFVKEWEMASLREHAAFARLVAAGDARGAADHLRDVHWSYAVQERFVKRYYFALDVETGARSSPGGSSRR